MWLGFGRDEWIVRHKLLILRLFERQCRQLVGTVTYEPYIICSLLAVDIEVKRSANTKLLYVGLCKSRPRVSAVSKRITGWCIPFSKKIDWVGWWLLWHEWHFHRVLSWLKNRVVFEKTGLFFEIRHCTIHDSTLAWVCVIFRTKLN